MPKHKSVLSTYIDNEELLKAIDDAATSSGKSASKLIADILQSHFLSPNAFRLMVERTELATMLEEQTKAELSLVDIQKRVKHKEFKVMELEDLVVNDWLEQQIRDTILDVEEPEERLTEFKSVVSNIDKPWLRERVEDYLNNGGLDRVKKELEGNMKTEK